MNPSLLVIAGEASGDNHAAAVLRELRLRMPTIDLWGIGGPALRAEGMETLHDIDEMEAIGLGEVLGRIPFFLRVMREMRDEARRRRPSAAMLVDYPGFNVRLAGLLKREGIPVLYYICPQVWAWHRSRIRRIARSVDRMLVLFPFEADLFRDTGLTVDFVGHPLADEVGAPSAAPSTPDWPGRPRIALLPGSRGQEIDRILPVLLAAAARLAVRHPEAGFLVAAVSDAAALRIRRLCDATQHKPERFAVVTGQTRNILATADAAWIASGTATLEAALLGCPMVVVYRTSSLTYHAARAVIRIPHIGLVNVVAGKEICPERIQADATPERLESDLLPLLSETPERQAMKQALAEVAARLGDGSAGKRAADAVARFLEEISPKQSP